MAILKATVRMASIIENKSEHEQGLMAVTNMNTSNDAVGINLSLKVWVVMAIHL